MSRELDSWDDEHKDKNASLTHVSIELVIVLYVYFQHNFRISNNYIISYAIGNRWCIDVLFINIGQPSLGMLCIQQALTCFMEAKIQ